MLAQPPPVRNTTLNYSTTDSDARVCAGRVRKHSSSSVSRFRTHDSKQPKLLASINYPDSMRLKEQGIGSPATCDKMHS